MSKFKITEELITPARAYELLKNNTKNRSLRKKTVIDYADQMKRGQWRLTSQTITFDRNGVLIDGQHRLAAVVKSQVSQHFLVARGAEHEEIFKVYDTGKKRDAGDVLSIEGVKNAKVISGMIKTKNKLDIKYKNLVGGDTLLTNTDVFSIYSQNPELMQETVKFANRCREKLKLYTSGYLGGIILHLILTRGHDTNEVYSFFEAVNFSSSHESTAPHLLREKLVNNMLSNVDFSPMIKLGLIKKAWNAYVDGKNPKILRVSFDEAKEIQFK